MLRRLVSRRTLKWTCTIACFLIALPAAATLKWRYIIINTHSGYVGISAGMIGIDWNDPSARTRPLLELGNYADWDEFRRDWAISGVWPERVDWFFGPKTFIPFPFWIPLILIGVPTAALWFLERRRPHAGCCRKCHYNLTGNTSVKCPECGTAYEPCSSIAR